MRSSRRIVSLVAILVVLVVALPGTANAGAPSGPSGSDAPDSASGPSGSDVPDSSSGLRPLATPDSGASVMCDDVPPYCDPVDGTIHDGSGNGVLPQVPGDPAPGTPGVWLGHRTSGRFCYANYNSFITDADQDWLDDRCEFELARAFAPAMAISPIDGCPDGEPYWAAKYFPNSAYGWGEFVRIAYMPAYYRDCGPIDGGHDGDSEFIRLTVHFNPATLHWEVRDGYLSAHAGTPTDSSDWVPREEFQYPTRYLAYPQVWVARHKHGNYRREGICDDGAIFTDTCDGNQTMGRLRVYRHRNAGSQFTDFFASGAMSENAVYRADSVREYFYTPRNFKGWQVGAVGVSPYANFLYSIIHECFMFAAGQYYCGPGPNPPSTTKLTGVIDGPPQVTAFQSYTWTTFFTGGRLPYQAQWSRKYASQSSFVALGTTGNGSDPFSAGSWTLTVDRCENFTLRVAVTSADNQYWYDDHAVTVACPPPPVTVYIDGPHLIQTKGSYLYTAVHSGFASPTFTWSERFCADYSTAACSGWLTITGLGSTFNRVLSPDCSGTGEKNFQVRVVVRNIDGRTATDSQTTALCQVLA